ncbi:MAG: hydantoinase B/oxoprolinase family protein [Aquificae bacterium]|nr:hydantoinase B/oxoprolinase family protein [Aquificota bacterium]
MDKKISPILLEVFNNRFSHIAEEMGVVLQRTAFSPNIKERRDFSCAIFDREGNLIAQAAHIPVHLGSMPLSVKSAIETYGDDFQEGDVVILNDPFKGGTHLPDITMVSPVFYEGELLFFVANRAHHADVGGMTAGSMPLSTSIFQEGIIIPPVKLVKGGKTDKELLSFFLNNVRNPYEREGDFAAQIWANNVGIKRLKELLSNYGKEEVLKYTSALLDYTETLTRKFIETIPDGVYEYTDLLEDDGFSNTDIKIKVKITVEGSSMTFDFSDSDPQTLGPFNAVEAITQSAVLYVLRSLLGKEEIPTNAGIGRAIKVITKKGTIVDAKFPAAVAAGNVETSQRIVDVILGALSKALPEIIPAAGQGTMNNLAIGGINPQTGEAFSYYETLGGGMGAWSGGDGESAIHSHMTNTLNTPVEALEFAYPMMVKEYSIRRGSGGEGIHRGGDGLVREIQLLTHAEVTLLTERRRIPPYGLFGGKPGQVGRNLINGQAVGGKFQGRLKKGDTIRIETPGGGGWGKPTD